MDKELCFIAPELIAAYGDRSCDRDRFYLISDLPQTFLPSVIPAKAGIQPELGIEHWIPAFAGMTVFSV